MSGMHVGGAKPPMYNTYDEYKSSDPWDRFKEITGYKHLSTGVIAIVIVLSVIIIVMAILLFVWAATNGAAITNSVATGCAITLGCVLLISGAIHVGVCMYYGVPIKVSKREASRRDIIPKRKKNDKAKLSDQ